MGGWTRCVGRAALRRCVFAALSHDEKPKRSTQTRDANELRTAADCVKQSAARVGVLKPPQHAEAPGSGASVRRGRGRRRRRVRPGDRRVVGGAGAEEDEDEGRAEGRGQGAAAVRERRGDVARARELHEPRAHARRPRPARQLHHRQERLGQVGDRRRADRRAVVQGEGDGAEHELVLDADHARQAGGGDPRAPRQRRRGPVRARAVWRHGGRRAHARDQGRRLVQAAPRRRHADQALVEEGDRGALLVLQHPGRQPVRAPHAGGRQEVSPPGQRRRPLQVLPPGGEPRVAAGGPRRGAGGARRDARADRRRRGRHRGAAAAGGGGGARGVRRREDAAADAAQEGEDGALGTRLGHRARTGPRLLLTSRSSRYRSR